MWQPHKTCSVSSQLEVQHHGLIYRIYLMCLFIIVHISTALPQDIYNSPTIHTALWWLHWELVHYVIGFSVKLRVVLLQVKIWQYAGITEYAMVLLCNWLRTITKSWNVTLNQRLPVLPSFVSSEKRMMMRSHSGSVLLLQITQPLGLHFSWDIEESSSDSVWALRSMVSLPWTQYCECWMCYGGLLLYYAD